ncbi:hypothetical protein ACSBR1_026138 [Camellia fascicularis]
MREGVNFMEHLDEFNQVLMELDAISAKIEEEDKAILLMVSLPPSYEHVRTTLMYEKNTLELDEAVTALISHETLRKRESDESSSKRNMVSSDNGPSRGRTMEKHGGVE